ncbi:MAG: hypothetical protein KDK53_23870 [Maritimibacter sp.]|nr:hypothetical protein [Maritimibacter sp.]
MNAEDGETELNKLLDAIFHAEPTTSGLSSINLPDASDNLRITAAISLAEGLWGDNPNLKMIALNVIQNKLTLSERIYIYDLLHNKLDWKILRRRRRGIKKTKTDLRIIIEVQKERDKGLTFTDSFESAAKRLNMSVDALKKRYYRVPEAFRLSDSILECEEIADFPYFEKLPRLAVRSADED